jgi:hypothetical protein
MAGALGKMYDALVEAAYPEFIGRNIINVKPTTEAVKRFPLAASGTAYLYGEIDRSGFQRAIVKFEFILLEYIIRRRENEENIFWNNADSAFNRHIDICV